MPKPFEAPEDLREKLPKPPSRHVRAVWVSLLMGGTLLVLLAYLEASDALASAAQYLVAGAMAAIAGSSARHIGEGWAKDDEG